MQTLIEDPQKGKLLHYQDKGHFLQSFEYLKTAVELQNSQKYLMQENGVIDDAFMQCNTYLPSYAEKRYKYYCNQNKCPVCFVRKIRYRYRAFYQKEHDLKQMQLCTHMLTFTFPDMVADEIKVFYENVSKCFTSLLNIKIFKRHVKGFIRAFEVTMNDLGIYHVHVHALIAFSMFLHAIRSSFRKNQLKLAYLPPFSDDGGETWDAPFLLKLIRRKIPNALTIHIGRAWKDFEVSVTSFLNYVTKIPNNISPLEWELWRSHTKNKRLITFSGIFRKSYILGA